MGKVYRAKVLRKLVIYGIILFGTIEVGLIRLVFPASFTTYLLFIPVYFLLLGIFLLLVLSRMKRKRLHPGRALARLMIFNISQMTLSFILMFLYYYFVKEQKDTVLLAFSVYYVFFMCIKLFVIYNIENQHKTEKKRLQHAKKEQ